MEKEIDPEVLKTTQISLGKYVKRPPLSEKLLRKPPFRFLHDIITSVLKSTGFFENLFDDDELVSDNVKDRDSKILFLTKVIFVVATTTGRSITAKPSKIVAGQEPDKTNELLQSLAQALDKKLSSEQAVIKYKESLKAPQVSETNTKDATKSLKKGNEPKKLTSKSSEKLSKQKNDTNVRSTSKSDKDKVNDSKSKRKEISNKVESQPKKSIQINASKKKIDNKGQNNEDTERQSKKKSTAVDQERVGHSLPKLQSQDSNVSLDKDDHIDVKLNEQQVTPRTERGEQKTLNDSYTIGEQDLNSTTSSHDLAETVNIEENKSFEINVKTEISVADDAISTEHNNGDNAKNSDMSGDYHDTSKPSFNDDQQIETENKVTVPRINESNKKKSPPTSANDACNDNVRPQSVRPSSSRPGAPRMREKLDNVVRDSDNLLLGKVNIIVENTQNEEDEDTSLVVIEQQMDLASTSNGHQEWNASSNEHGHLVQLILDSQKELSQISGKTEIEWQFGAQKAREAINQEIEQLRYNIQALSRVANPLGKLLDHIQEDVEVMRQELQQWTNIYDEVTKEMLKQKTINEDSLLPLHTKLKQLERDIEEKHDKINDLKILVHQNASRIDKLLGSGDVQ